MYREEVTFTPSGNTVYAINCIRLHDGNNKRCPSHWISKATIARRSGISRVTADKQLTRIQNDEEL